MEAGFSNIESLSFSDRILFTHFGRGPRVRAPFSLIHRGFESIADRYPQAIAVQQDDGATITYGELEKRSNLLSNKLTIQGLVPKQRVCLVFHRSIHMVIAVLAVLKAGCQYVPLDGGVVPDETLNHILDDTKAPFVICQAQYEFKVRSQASASVAVLVIEAEMDGDQLHGSVVRPRTRLTKYDGAYIIYTSGTTGLPKGVDVSHKNVVNALSLQPSCLDIQVGSKVAQILSISFDMAAWEILGTLINGGCLFLRGSDWERTLSKVDTVIATPSILGRYQKSDYPNITTAVAGGEPCPQKLADEWSVSCKFYNICGPTEITILNTAHLHRTNQPITIGRPLPNTNVYILDEAEKPVAVGEVGTMWVGGRGVSRGYLNRQELTAQRFKSDKFTQDGTTMFNTGDLVRWREDGSLEHHGRVDDQVKFKGFRLELDGISRIIEAHSWIRRACTLVIGDKLWAFYSSPAELDTVTLRAFVARCLPYYAVPTQWRHFQVLPSTANGKVDKAALRKLATSNSIQALTIPTSSPAPLRRSWFSKNLEQGGITEIIDYPDSPSTCYSLDITDREYDDKDLEKGAIVETRKMSFVSGTTAVAQEKPVPEELPAKNGFHGERWLRHRFFSLYRRLFSVVLLGNIAALVVILSRSWRSNSLSLSDLANAVSINLLVTVLMRQDHVINVLFAIATSAPTWTPLCIRRQLARVYHIGGIHSGCAVAAVMWFVVFNGAATRPLWTGQYEDSISMPALIVSYFVVFLFFAILVSAHPTIRQKWHNEFEISHRFAGWSVLALLWAQTILVTDSLRTDITLGHALVTNPSFWLLSTATASIIYPWLHLRKVAVRPELLSNHAIRLHFDYTETYPGTAVRISRNPLLEWHAFATIAKPGVKGFSLVVSKAGDWTGKTIAQMPTHIYKRGVPACGVLAIAPLFKKVVLVATGSGIGPCLPVIYAKKVPCRVIWSTPNPVTTFGQEIVDAIYETDSEAVVHDTKKMGRPDLVQLSWRAYRDFGAEAVCIISNQKITQKFVYAMEARGIPAFGAIWDS
ncbi:putative nonribosomal peptide synthetase 12 protein [Venturia nashicola]|uniref:Putative nonribosomal peptide synthetase 12 protein n=1 Tax=Venturia nashicola TaxID=86259 RepID=A0A4Z1P1B3_9PEZI|nr:putative nonribosomal peptide synthetase 12 protein [Venturia nashicola]TLD32669.1 putative nonribosomal peptide synthetase 12 protein [Venturia nashicola]